MSTAKGAYSARRNPATRSLPSILITLAFLSGALSSATTQAQDLAKLPDIVERIAPAVVSVSTVGVEEKAVSDQNVIENGEIFNHPAVLEAIRKNFDNLRPASEGNAKTLPKLDSPAGEAHEFVESQGKAGSKTTTSSSSSNTTDTGKAKRYQASGMVVSPDGYIVTADFVINGATSISASFEDGNLLRAELVGVDPRTSVALLKVNPPSPLIAVSFADSDRVRRGQAVIAMGNPFGLAGSATFGIVAGKSRDVGGGPYDSLQIDAAINKGNSGGPVFDLNGEVVGMTVSIYSPTGGNVGIAFAVPSNVVKSVAESLKRTGTVERGWLGVKIQNVDADKAKGIGLASTEGALVTEISPAGPAAGSDLKAGDVIVKVKGKKVADSRDLARTIAELKPKEKADLLVWRGGKEQSIVVELGVFPSVTQPGQAKPGASNQSAPAVNDDDFEGLDKLE